MKKINQNLLEQANLRVKELWEDLSYMYEGDPDGLGLDSFKNRFEELMKELDVFCDEPQVGIVTARRVVISGEVVNDLENAKDLIFDQIRSTSMGVVRDGYVLDNIEIYFQGHRHALI